MSNAMQNNETVKTESAPKQQSPLLYALVTVMLFAVMTAGGFWLYKGITRVDYVTANIKEASYRLEVANTQSKREKGLSERDSLPAGQGMLFDFQQDGDWSIWMLQMRFPLDVLWLDADKKIVALKTNATPGSYPEVFRAGQRNRYVIELNAGEVQKRGLEVGDTLRW